MTNYSINVDQILLIATRQILNDRNHYHYWINIHFITLKIRSCWWSVFLFVHITCQICMYFEIAWLHQFISIHTRFITNIGNWLSYYILSNIHVFRHHWDQMRNNLAIRIILSTLVLYSLKNRSAITGNCTFHQTIYINKWCTCNYCAHNKL